MDLFRLLLLLTLAAATIHLTRFWARVALITTIFFTALLLAATANVSSDTIEIIGLAFSFEPAAREFLLIALALCGALALATCFASERDSIGFLFWSWPLWMLALIVNNFVIGVFAWTVGLVLTVLAMRPRRFQRAGGAAFYLVLVVVGTACLLIANRFIELYPVSPDQVSLLRAALLFLGWGLGLLLALVPFHFWLGPMADETPLPLVAMILGFGQPIGLWLLLQLLAQNPRLTERTDLFVVMTLGGLASVILAGGLLAVERRAGRVLAYAAIFSLGFALLNLGEGTSEGLAFAAVEIFSRALALTVMAVSIEIAREVKQAWVQRAAVGIFVLAGLQLAGLRLGVGLAERWNYLSDPSVGGSSVFWVLIVAHIGFVIGIVRFAIIWLREPDLALAIVTDAVAPVEVVETETIAAVPDQSYVRVIEVQAVPVLESVGAAPGNEMIIRGNGERGDDVVATAEEIVSGPGPTPEQPTVPSPGLAGESTTDDEYVFEEHMRQILTALARRLRPYIVRAAHSLPTRGQQFLKLVLITWRVWTSLALLAALAGLLLMHALLPGLVFQHAVALFGQPAFLK